MEKRLFSPNESETRLQNRTRICDEEKGQFHIPKCLQPPCTEHAQTFAVVVVVVFLLSLSSCCKTNNTSKTALLLGIETIKQVFFLRFPISAICLFALRGAFQMSDEEFASSDGGNGSDGDDLSVKEKKKKKERKKKKTTSFFKIALFCFPSFLFGHVIMVSFLPNSLLTCFFFFFFFFSSFRDLFLLLVLLLLRVAPTGTRTTRLRATTTTERKKISTTKFSLLPK